jgi:hypothetical protein
MDGFPSVTDLLAHSIFLMVQTPVFGSDDKAAIFAGVEAFVGTNTRIFRVQVTCLQITRMFERETAVRLPELIVVSEYSSEMRAFLGSHRDRQYADAALPEADIFR